MSVQGGAPADEGLNEIANFLRGGLHRRRFCRQMVRHMLASAAPTESGCKVACGGNKFYFSLVATYLQRRKSHAQKLGFPERVATARPAQQNRTSFLINFDTKKLAHARAIELAMTRTCNMSTTLCFTVSNADAWSLIRA